MRTVAVRSLWERKLRTILTALAVVLGVMMVAGTYVLTDTIDASFEEIFTEGNEGTDAVVTSREVVETDDDSLPPFDARVLDQVRATDGVLAASGAIADQSVAIIGSDGEPLGTEGAPSLGFSTEPGDQRFDPLTYVEGGRPAADDEVVIDRASAESEGYEIGDRITLAGRAGTGEYTLAGIATLGDVDNFGGATFVVLTLPEAQRITGKEGQLDQINVAAQPGTSPEQLAANLSEALPRSVEVETGEENVQSSQDDIEEFVGFLQTALLVFAGVSLFVASFLIFNTFSITVAQRTREFALLRTLGANRRQIIGSVVLEAFLIGFAASVIGVLAGIGFARGIDALFSGLGIDLPSTEVVIATRTVIIGLVLGTGLTVLAALIPAIRATRIPPVTGLREGAVLATPREHRLRAAGGVALAVLGGAAMVLGLFGVLDPGELWLGVGAGAVFIGVAILSPQLVAPLASVVGRPLERLRGIPGRLARENATRNPGRTASTAAALMIGVALVAFVAVFAAGLRGSIDDAIAKTITGDLIVSHTDGFSDIPARTTEAVESVEGVEVASPTRYTQNELEDTSGGGYLTLIHPETAAQVLTFEWEDGSQELVRELGPTDAIVDEGWADDNDLAVGDTFRSLTPSGEEITYTIRGTFKDNTDFFGDYAASDVNAAAYNEGDSVSNVFIRVAAGADAGAVQGDIETALEADFPTVQVQDQEQLKDSIGEQLNGLLGIVYGLLALSVIVSLFGIVNTLALSIHERTRELGLLRAVGTSRRQVRRMVRYESVITSLIGAVLGIVLGVIFAVLISRPLADEGFTLSIPVVTLIVLLVLAALAGVVAAIGPARRASRLDVLRALAYE